MKLTREVISIFNKYVSFNEQTSFINSKSSERWNEVTIIWDASDQRERRENFIFNLDSKIDSSQLSWSASKISSLFIERSRRVKSRFLLTAVI